MTIPNGQVTTAKIVSAADLTREELTSIEETSKFLESVLEERRQARSRGRRLLCHFGIHKPVSNQAGEKACIRCQKLLGHK